MCPIFELSARHLHAAQLEEDRIMLREEMSPPASFKLFNGFLSACALTFKSDLVKKDCHYC